MRSSIRRSCLAVLTTVCLFTTGLHAQNDPASRRAAIEGMYPIMMHALQTKSFGRARNICDQAILWEPQNPVHHYNLACIEAQAGGARLTHAWGALALSIALGFDDAEHMRTDPDLAPLRSDPRFADLVRKVAYDVSAGAAIDAIKIPESVGRSTATREAMAESAIETVSSFRQDLPVGPYFMTRFTPATQTVEKSVWYFAPSGEVFSGLETGFTPAEVHAHAGPRGKIMPLEGKVLISWSDGRQTRARLEREGNEFTWDMMLFAPVQAFETSNEAAGVYECVESIPAGTGPSVPQRLELRIDGTFVWEGASYSAGAGGLISVKSGHNETAAGTWEIDGFSLRLKAPDGIVLRRLVFPSDDDKTVIKPDRMFFAGVVFKRRP